MLEQKILDTINEYNLIESGDTVIAAVSGGPDSMCMLNVLNNIKENLKIKEIVVAHVNHMLRKEAEEETKFVEAYCKENNIRFFVKYVDIKKIAKDNKQGEEETGRKARYDFFEEVAKKVKADKIAIAHNYNDNAETILMHIMRGTGISGLIGIKPYRDGKYIRPIIKCSRDEIEDYCKKQKLNPKYDKSNKNNEYTRNRIRNKLIPYISKEFDANIVETLNRLSEVVLQEDDFMQMIVLKEYNDLLIKEERNKISIDVKKFNKLHEYMKSKVILFIIDKLFGSTQGIEKIHIKDIIKLCSNNIGNKYLTPNKNVKIFIKSGTVSFEKVLK